MAVNGPLEHFGRYLDDMIKEMVTTLSSFVQDTRDVLTRMQKIVVPEGAILVGVHVESLYTSILNNWGIQAVAHLLRIHYPEMETQN